MELTCHRCSATVEPEAYYCQNCGAPQIRFIPQEEETSAASDKTTGASSQISNTDQNNAVQWKLAIQIAISVAVAVGILSTLLATGSVLWVAAGAVIVIGIYHRRQPHTFLARRTGARIGALVGLLAAAVYLAGNAITFLIQRYALHQGNQIDTKLSGIVKQAADRAASMDPQAPIASFTNFWLSAEGRIGLILLTMGFLAALILLFAIAGGVLGAQIYRSPRNRKAAL